MIFISFLYWRIVYFIFHNWFSFWYCIAEKWMKKKAIDFYGKLFRIKENEKLLLKKSFKRTNYTVEVLTRKIISVQFSLARSSKWIKFSILYYKAIVIACLLNIKNFKRIGKKMITYTLFYSLNTIEHNSSDNVYIYMLSAEHCLIYNEMWPCSKILKLSKFWNPSILESSQLSQL